jgi:hypothetical protein
MNAPGVLERGGYTRRQLFELFKPGTEVTVSGFQSKSGAPVVVFSKAVTPTGELKSLNGPGKLD